MNSYLAMLLGATLNGTAGIFLKHSAMNSSGELASMASRPMLPLLAAASYVGAFIFYFLALKATDLSLAYILMTAITAVLVTVYGGVVLGESLTATRLVGISLAIVGIALMTRPGST